MKYYKIGFSFDEQLIGKFPQIEYFYAKEYDQNKESSFMHLSSLKFPTIAPDLNCFFLDRRAKITNLLSSTTLKSSIGFFIDQKLVQLLKEYTISHIKYYALQIDFNYQANSPISFYFAHIVSNYEALDYKKTTIFNVVTSEEITVDSEQKFREIFTSTNSAFMFVPEKYTLNTPYSIVRPPISGDIYISEKFKSILEENEITGIEFKPTDKVVLG